MKFIRDTAISHAAWKSTGSIFEEKMDVRGKLNGAAAIREHFKSKPFDMKRMIRGEPVGMSIFNLKLKLFQS